MNHNERQAHADYIESVMQGNKRGEMTDIADDYAMFMREIEASHTLTPAAIGYVSHVMHETRARIAELLAPEEDSSLSEMIAPAVIGAEEGCMRPSCSAQRGGEAKMIEILDLGLIATMAATRTVLLGRIRKCCGTAEMLASIKPGMDGPSAEFAIGLLNSINRLFRLLDAIDISFTGDSLSRFDLQAADAKIRKYIADNSPKQG